MLTRAVRDRRVRRILEMVPSGLPHTIRDLAVEFNLSPSRLQHLFKQQTGARLGQWLIEQRLERAAHLLARSNMRVKEIAYSVGYEHTSSFVRAFERRYAQAPRYYRQQSDSTKC